MDTPLVSTQRLSEILQQIDEAKLRAAFATIMSRHGIHPDVPEKIRRRLSPEPVFYKKIRRTISGHPEHNGYVLYAAGLADRAAMGGNYVLLTLNVDIHERTHSIVGRREEKPVRRSVHGVSFKFTRCVRGFHTTMEMYLPHAYSPNATGAATNYFLNEGATESFAREVMREYLRLDPDFAGVTHKAMLEYWRYLDCNAPWCFYPESVQLFETLAFRMTSLLGAAARSPLYLANFECTDLVGDALWQKRFRHLRIGKLMRKIAAASIDDVAKLTSELESTTPI